MPAFPLSLCKILAVLALAVILARPGRAHALAPYTADADTLFLFHLDEAGTASATANLGSRGGSGYAVNMAAASATPPLVTGALGAASFAGFGTSAQISSTVMIGWDYNASGAFQGDNGTTLSADSFAASVLNMGNGGQTPWTIEAMISSTAAALTANQEIICTDSSAASRGFQFRLNSAGQLQMSLLATGADIKTAVPTAGAHAYAPDTWYHVAVSYDGTNVRLYWTRLDSGVASANLLSTTAASVGTSFGAVTGPLCLGGENRGANGEPFQGRIDEVRISKVARAASAFLFAPDPNDTDADGLLDSWEQQIINASASDGITTLAHVLPGDDFDGDGTTNKEEFTANTNPVNASSTPNRLYVDLRATAASGAGSATWTNFGALGNFARVGTPSLVANVEGTGVPGVLFNGASDAYSSLNVTSADLEGNSDRSIEAWIYNPAITVEESLVSWGRRSGARANVSLNHGFSTGWGAATHFNDDVGWTTVPSTGAWHHLAYVYAGANVARVYVDGVLANSRTLSAALATAASNPINIGAQREGSGSLSSGIYFGGYINSVRVQGRALTAQEVAADYALGPVGAASVNTDNDGLSDAWELANFNGLGQTAAGNADGDPATNGAEQAAGTDPNDPSVYPGAPIDPSMPTGLMVDLLAYPERTTIPDTQPEFTWIFNQRERGESQSAYEILVASSAVLASQGSGDVWVSGKIASAQSVNVAYAGPALSRGARYYWRVRTWAGGAGPSAWSASQVFTIEPTLPQTGARSLYKASADDFTGYNFAGRYRSAFDAAVAPVNLVAKGGGNYFIDFGRAAFGYVTIRLNGNYSGQTLTVRLGEAADGFSVDTTPPGAYVRYGSTTVALQNGNLAYEARYASTVTGLYNRAINLTNWAGAVMPFRYVELLNCPGTLTAADIRQQVLAVPFDDTAASFASSNGTLNSVWDLCRHSMKATTFAAAYVDGDREREPYEGDIYINQLGHYGADREFTIARYTYEFRLQNPTWPLEWYFHFLLIAWADYMATGNKEALAANYASLKGVILTNNERSSDGAFQSPNPGNVQTEPADIIDWPSAERDGYAISSANAISTVPNAFHYNALRLGAQMAAALDNAADATDLNARADKIQTLFAGATFWNGSLYKDGETPAHVSAHANFFPVALGSVAKFGSVFPASQNLVPSARLASMMTFLKTSRVINGRTESMPCSVYAAQYFIEALFDGGEDDHAISLMADNSTSRKRHWHNMIAEGSTMTMEAWGQEFKTNQDWNHAWGGAPANLIPRYVLGLKPLTAGFAQAEIKPQLGTGSASAGLTSAAGTIPTIRGPVKISAENSPTTFKLAIKTPGNMVTNLSIPTKGLASPSLIVDGRVVTATVVAGRLVLENLPAGEHAIWLSGTANPSAAVLQENWKKAMFGDNAANLAISGDSADPDNDGFNNAAEFSANTDPLSANAVPDDGDHLPTAWENAWFGNTVAQNDGSDPDADGTNNYAELRLGLNPTDPNSRFLATFDGATVTWRGVSGVTFNIQRSTDLKVWGTIATKAGVNGTNTFVDPEPPAGVAFYRVILNS